MDGHISTLVQWSDSLLMLRRKRKNKEIRREKRYSETRSAQWRQMVRWSRFTWQGNKRNFKNKIRHFKCEFKLTFFLKTVTTEKKSNTNTYSDITAFQFKLLENIMETEMEPIQLRTQNEPQYPKYILVVCVSSFLNLDGEWCSRMFQSLGALRFSRR